MEQNRNYRSYSLRGIAVSGLVILFFVSIILTYYVMLLGEMQDRITTVGELNATASAEQIDRYLAEGVVTMNLACYTLDSMIRAGRSHDEIRAFLVSQSDAIMSTSLETTGLYAYIDGDYLDGTDWVPGAGFVPTERPWYIDARANVGRVAVVDPYIDAQTNTVMITFSKLLCDAKSVAAIDYSMDRLQTITEEISAKNALALTIVLDRKYRVVAHSNRSEVGKSYHADDGTLGGALVNELRESNKKYFSLHHDGAEYIVYSVSVSNDWLCLSVFDATAAFNQLRQTLLITILVVVLVIAVLLYIMIQLNRKHEQVARLSVQAVEAIAAAIDAKDSYTKGHSDRVAKYAREIASRYGYTEKQQQELYMMGLLHDVGKIGVPDTVITKPGKLTNEEFDMIKKHPVIGSDILSKTSELSRLATGARWHHERFNGTGYPDGLAGKEIPEEARIIAVADAYDAMTSRRSYRNDLPQEVVRSEIEKGRGSQFDPVFADIMLDMIAEDEDYTMRDTGEA